MSELKSMLWSPCYSRAILPNTSIIAIPSTLLLRTQAWREDSIDSLLELTFDLEDACFALGQDDEDSTQRKDFRLAVKELLDRAVDLPVIYRARFLAFLAGTATAESLGVARERLEEAREIVGEVNR